MDQNLSTNSHEPFHSFSHQELIIANTKIRQDKEGRYCLNDFHRASGMGKSKQPNEWLRNKQTKELVSELTSAGISGHLNNASEIEVSSNMSSPINIITNGLNEDRGIYVVKELVYAYAMWISPAFHVVNILNPFQLTFLLLLNERVNHIVRVSIHQWLQLFFLMRQFAIVD